MKYLPVSWLSLTLLSLAPLSQVIADPLSAHMMEQITIKGRQTDLLGLASSASGSR